MSTAPARKRISERAGMSAVEFKAFRKIIKDVTGIDMSEAKKQLVERRINSRLKDTEIGSFREYLQLIQKGGNDPEIQRFCNAVTTNLTSFFRENHHFDFLRDTIVPEILKRKSAERRMRIWSAGCSTGEEPYSIAMTLKEAMPELNRWDAKILCTDLDTDVLAACKAGLYREDRIDGLQPSRVKRWFSRCEKDGKSFVQVHRELQALTFFKPLNLMQSWPMKGPFDLIFCRNVFIYFDKPTQRSLVDRFADLLEDDCYLIVGHSESLANVSDRFELIGKTIYRKLR